MRKMQAALVCFYSSNKSHNDLMITVFVLFSVVIISLFLVYLLF